jgi:two-component system NtrC family sensor kinase
VHPLTDVPAATTTLDERQLLRTAKLAAIGQLTAGFAHELNNPLFGVLGLVEFLLKETEPGTKAYERLALVQSTALEMKQILRALLEFARESSDERRVVPLDEVVADSVNLIRRASAGKGVEIELSHGDGAFYVDGMPNQLKQLVLALLANARQAMPDGGTVRVRVDEDADVVTATVRDEGDGIAPELLERIFEPFFTTRAEHGGIGLGLWVAGAIARRHGGELTASSAPGEGACFTLRLPRHGGCLGPA